MASVFIDLFQPSAELTAYSLGKATAVRTTITSHGAAQEDSAKQDCLVSYILGTSPCAFGG